MVVLLFPLIFCEHRNPLKDILGMCIVAISMEVEILSNYLVGYIEGNKNQNFP